MGMKLTSDELSGRGLETFQDPVEMGWSFTALIRAIPKGVSKEKVLEEFDNVWQHVRGD